MKRFKKVLSFLMALALCLTPLFGSSMQVQAATEPTTYYVKYVNDGIISDWRYQIGSWKEDGYHRELYYLMEYIKDGDKLVIEGSGEKPLTLTLDVQLGELGFAATVDAPIVTVKGADKVYGIMNGSFVLNGDVKNAYVYESCACNFNNNVEYLEIITGAADTIIASVYVGGTVDHAKYLGRTRTLFDLYNFQAGSFYVANGALQTKQEQYSATPSVATPAPAPVAPAAPATPSTGGEYDDVPKTADTQFNPLWLVGLSVLCLAGAGSLAFKKER